MYTTVFTEYSLLFEDKPSKERYPPKSHPPVEDDVETFKPQRNKLASHPAFHKIKAAMADYKGSGFQPINQHLRARKGAGPAKTHVWAKSIHHLDHATSQEIGHHLTVHRVVRSSDPERSKKMQELKAGRKITDHGYGSTSLDKYVATGFHDLKKEQDAKAVDQKHKPTYHHHIIHLKPHNKAYYLDQHDHDNIHEQEVLIHRSTTFKVVHHTVHPDGSTTTHLEVHKQK